MGAGGSRRASIIEDGWSPQTKPDNNVQLECAGVSLPTYNDPQFSKIRAGLNIPDSFLFDFDFNKMGAGGGKGGNLLAIHGDYVVKEMNATDHNTLLNCAKLYADHVLMEDRNGNQYGTMLCKVLCHFYDPSTGKNFMAMDNVTPNPVPPGLGDKGRRPSANRSTYDLKGCADDKTLTWNNEKVNEVHKRVWNAGMWCGQCLWSKERKNYYAGKLNAANTDFHVTETQKEKIEMWIKRDCTFLSDLGLMDYSLMVSCLTLERGDPDAEAWLNAAAGNEDSVPFVSMYDGKVQVLHVGIIDFLQDWTFTKNIAMCIKFLECNKATIPPGWYAARFIETFCWKFNADAQEVAAPAGV